MKKQLSLIIMLMLVSTLQTIAQSPNWVWAKSAGGTNPEWATTMTTDPSGNVYLVGNFQSDSITFGSTTLFSSNYLGIFLVKYDGSGNVLWAADAVAFDNVGVTSVTTDLIGNIYIAGYFNDTIIFGSFTLTNEGMFIAKYDSNGNVLWAKSSDGSDSYINGANSITTDAAGFVYVAGFYNGSFITFGSITLNNPNGFGFSSDMFLVKYDQTGNVLWATSAGGISDDGTNSVATDLNGNIYVSGWFNYSITFGATTLFSVNTSWKDIFLVKYDASGNPVWALGAGGGDWEEAYSVITDVSGNIYMAGQFYSDSISFNSVTLLNDGYYDLFLTKFDSNGNVIWVKSDGGSGGGSAGSIISDASSNIYMAGSFGDSTIIFGSDTLMNVSSSAFGALYTDGFLAKYDSAGNVLWAKSAGALYHDGMIVTADVSGNIYVGGNFDGPEIIFDTDTLINHGWNDVFIAKLDTASFTSINSFEIFGKEISIFPNPFYNSATISFSLPQSEKVSVKIFDMTGRIVKTLADVEMQEGAQQINWNATDEKGNAVDAGIYFLKLDIGNYSETKKLLVVK
ncbi:MAG TPA: T9SS type A sorting domain-containing protein [Chitinophagales bacterium]|nr:T9SS type A sorting domain-containing protein [Chitinophagales bacterium]